MNKCWERTNLLYRKYLINGGEMRGTGNHYYNTIGIAYRQDPLTNAKIHG